MLGVPSIFSDPVRLTFVDEDSLELVSLERPEFVPRVGENVRLSGRPFQVERVGYDFPNGALERIWVVCRPV